MVASWSHRGRIAVASQSYRNHSAIRYRPHSNHIAITSSQVIDKPFHPANLTYVTDVDMGTLSAAASIVCTAPPSPPPNPPPRAVKDELSDGAIIGIAIGASVGGILLLAVVANNYIRTKAESAR